MRALVITKAGPPEVLQVQERPDPQPGPGQVRVRVRAAGINFADIMARQGVYPDAPPLPAVVGYEYAGEIESLGDGVEGHSVGDRVMGGCRFGGYAELVVVRAGDLIPLPVDWSFEEGASLPVNYATAYAGLVRYGSLREGETVLIHAAAGGVGIAATQIARLAGAGTIYGTASPGKHDAIRGFGVDEPIDYTAGSFAKEVRRRSGQKEPLDLALDAIGGRSFARSYSLLRAGGRLVCFGAASVVGGEGRSIPSLVRTFARTPVFHPLRMSSVSKSVIGLNLLTLWDSKKSLDEYVEPLGEWVESGAIRPVVAEAFPLERGPDAHRLIQERKNVGKVVLTL